MKQEIKTKEAIFPMPVLMISTFNEDGSVDVMNAAWGTMLERDRVALNLTETHKTVQNIKARKGFVVHIADVKHVVEADYFGIASGNTEKEKFAKSGMTYTKSDLVDAPVINEFPIAMECEFIEYQSDDTGLGLKSKETLRKNYINPAIELEMIRMTIPDKPNSKNQRYVKV